MTLFDEVYRPDDQANWTIQDASELARFEKVAPGICDFMSNHGGLSFNNSVYRIYSVDRLANWNRTVLETFPEFRNRAFCFSCDWLGRQFALDLQRVENSRCLLLLFEPGTGDALEVPVSFAEFHDELLVNSPEGALASDFYTTAWLPSGGAIPSSSECIGYKKPLFLGGVDDTSNLELTDMDVYWTICGQLLAKVRNLPDGTRVSGVEMKTRE